MKKKVLSLLLIFAILVTMVPYGFAISENLYTADIVNLGDGIIIESDASLSVDYDNTEGENKFINFFSKSSDEIVAGELYKVSYTINVTELVGEVELFISSRGGNSQLGNQSEYLYLYKTGVTSKSYTVNAAELAETQNYMLRSYMYMLAGSKLKCSIKILVTKVSAHSIKIYNSVTDIPDEDLNVDSAIEGNVISYHIGNVDMVRNYISVVDSNGVSVPFTNIDGVLSFVMPNADVVVTICPYSIEGIVDGQIIAAQSANDKKYLFLPASAKLNELKLSGYVTVKGENDNSYKLTPTGVVCDITTLFDKELLSGVEYPVLIYNSEEYLDTIYIMKADNIATIYVDIDKSIAEINRSKSVEGSGTAVMVNADGVQINADTKLKKFKGRGNSSWEESGDKRPYNMNLSVASELIEGAGASKKWCLITDNCLGDWVRDAASLANIVTYDLYRTIGGNSALSTQSVNLYVNGEYRGVYLLTEKVEIDKERVDIKASKYLVEDDAETTLVLNKNKLKDRNKLPMYWDFVDTSRGEYLDDEVIEKGVQAYQYATNSELKGSSGGFLLELDRNFFGEASWFVTKRGYPYVFKEPEFATKEQVMQAAAYVQDYEDAVFSGTGYNSLGKSYTEYVDIDSFAKKILVDMVSAQCDTFITSCFFNMNVDANGVINTKIFAGPAWDYDGADYANDYDVALSNISPSKNGYVNQKYMIGQLLKHSEFAQNLADLNKNVVIPAWSELVNSKLDSYIANLTSSQAMNTVRWNTANDKASGVRCNDPGNFENFKKFYTRRFNLWPGFWDGKLQGVGIERDGNTLIATAPGYAGNVIYQWLKLSDDKQYFYEVSEGTHSTYVPEIDGTYCVKIIGNSIVGANVTQMYSPQVKVNVMNDYVIENLNTENDISFDVQITNFKDEGSTLIAVGYDSADRLVSVLNYPVSLFKAFSYEGIGVEKVKLLWWNGLDSMQPLHDIVELKTQ